MPQRGDMVVERLTKNRAIVIRVVSTEEVTCRFADGRLEDRFVFELETPPSFLGSLWSVVTGPFGNSARGNPAPAVSGRVRPLLARQPGA